MTGGIGGIKLAGPVKKNNKTSFSIDRILILLALMISVGHILVEVLR